jgi:hypothetical protein
MYLKMLRLLKTIVGPRTLICAFVIASAAAANAVAQTPATPAAGALPAKNDYSKAESWICDASPHDACSVDLSTSVISANGKITIEKFAPNPNPPIDCFYVYPTVSSQETINSDMTLGPEEKGVVRAQLARFGSVCRLYAPLYRQFTLGALRQMMAGLISPEALEHARLVAYGDVLDSWRYYLEHNNQGRGVVLIGHSQGSGVLMHLIQNEIDGKPVQSRLVSALLIGANVPVPKRKDAGGAFQHIPLCRSASQTGCLISYVSFRATAPPPDNSHFGRVSDPSMMAACANPAALGGGSGELHAYLPSNDSSNIVHVVSSPQPPWVTPPVPINTPFVSVPGMLTAECLSNDHGSYLAVSVHDDPGGARAHDIGGDLVVNGNVMADWGLHLIDVNLTIGNLVDVVAQQSAAYLKTAASR